MHPSFPEGKSLALQRSEGLVAYRYGNLFVFIIPQTTRFVKNYIELTKTGIAPR